MGATIAPPRTNRGTMGMKPEMKDLNSDGGQVELTGRTVRYNPLPALKFRVRNAPSTTS
jgi:hypothetical protein